MLSVADAAEFTRMVVVNRAAGATTARIAAAPAGTSVFAAPMRLAVLPAVVLPIAGPAEANAARLAGAALDQPGLAEIQLSQAAFQEREPK